MLGVIIIVVMRKVLIVCIVVIIEVDSRIKNIVLSRFGFSLMVLVWVLLKKIIIRFFYFSSRMVSEIILMIVSCSVFDGVMVRMLFMVMV